MISLNSSGCQEKTKTDNSIPYQNIQWVREDWEQKTCPYIACSQNMPLQELLLNPVMVSVISFALASSGLLLNHLGLNITCVYCYSGFHLFVLLTRGFKSKDLLRIPYKHLFSSISEHHNLSLKNNIFCNTEWAFQFEAKLAGPKMSSTLGFIKIRWPLALLQS